MEPRRVKPLDVVVVSCITFETVKVVSPIVHLRADRVYLLHYSEAEERGGKDVYSAFYEEVVDQLKTLMQLDDESIKEVNVKVFRFKEVLTALLEILQRERDQGNIVYVNVSAGSMEYAAAATLASMMVAGVKPVAVGVETYLIPNERIMEVYFENGHPVGLAKSVYEPTELPTYPIDMPPADLVQALRILRTKLESKLITSYPNMIKALKETKAWTYEGLNVDEKITQAEKMFYSRHYIESWLNRGWVEKEKGKRGKMKLTIAGENVCDIFHLEQP